MLHELIDSSTAIISVDFFFLELTFYPMLETFSGWLWWMTKCNISSTKKKKENQKKASDNVVSRPPPVEPKIRS